MEKRGRRPHVDVETLQIWEQRVWDTSVPWTPPYNMEKQLLDEFDVVFNRTIHEDIDALQSVSWSWTTACSWIAWQTLDGAALGVAAFRHWRGMIWREKEWNLDVRPGRLMPVPTADRLLLNALQSEKLTAEAVRDGEVVPIGAGEWPRLEWEKASHGEVMEFDRLLMLGALRYEGVTLAREAVMRLWPARDGWAPDGADVVDIDPADVREVRPTAPEVDLVAISAPQQSRQSRQSVLTDFDRIRAAAVDPPMPPDLDRDEYRRELERRCECRIDRRIARDLHKDREVYPGRPGMGPRKAKSLGKESRHK